MDPNLKLQTTMTKVCQNEAAKEQRQQLQAGDSKAFWQIPLAPKTRILTITTITTVTSILNAES